MIVFMGHLVLYSRFHYLHVLDLAVKAVLSETNDCTVLQLSIEGWSKVFLDPEQLSIISYNSILK